MNSAKSIELVIINGGQAGARSLLKSGQAIEISSSLDSDIILNDPLVDGKKITLELNETAANMDVVSGEVDVMGEPLTEGERVQLTAYQSVTMGDTTFAYGETDSPHWSRLIGSDKAVQMDVSTELAADVEADEVQIERDDSIAWVKYVALFALIIFIILGGLAFSTTSSDKLISKEDYVTTAKEAIADAGFENIDVSLNSSNVIVISGYIVSSQEYATLERLLDAKNISASIQLQVGEQMATKVEDVYRLNGVSATVSLDSPGVVVVKTNEADLENLAKVQQTVLNDVMGLSNIVAENTVPEEVPEEERLGDPLKRITMIVPGDSPYIVTKDRSRYYGGAMLPTGHKIKAITQNTVILIKGGKEKILEF